MSEPAVTGSPQLVRKLQERAARAFPAEHVESVDGWLLRRSSGSAWWVRSVLPHADADREELGRRVLRVERFYAEHDTPARFQISPGACPEALDAVLAERGYRREGPMSLQVAPTAHIAERTASGSLPVRLDEGPTREWFQVWHAAHEMSGDGQAEWDMLHRVDQPSAYVGATIGDRVVAVGRVVADDGWAGLFGMATVPQARGRGAGRSVLAALAMWAAARGTDRLYLQVECDNAAAWGLYQGAGFAEVSRYHYRVEG